MVVYRGIPVNLPAADTAEMQQGDILVVTIDDQGQVFVDKEPIAYDALLPYLKNAVGAFPDRAVNISGHRDAPYGVFVHVLDQARLAGCERVSIEAMPKEKGSKP